MVVGLFALGLTSVVLFHDRMPVVSTLALLAVLGAWYGSLQHEVVHGHPTPWARLNVALVGTPLGLIFPFWLYRSDHLEHHATEELTDPISDPESAYLLEARWDATSSPIRALRRCNTSLIGRMAIGPAFVIAGVARELARRIVDDDRRWATVRFLTADAAVLGVSHWLGLPAWQFAVGFGYCGLSLTLVRSFAEHRAASDGPHTAVVNSRGFWALLFLNNNLHVDHHRHPGAAWYRLPALHRTSSVGDLDAVFADTYSGYFEVFRRFLVHPIGPVVHPIDRAPADRAA